MSKQREMSQEQNLTTIQGRSKNIKLLGKCLINHKTKAEKLQLYA
jgi:hypothetical protein